MAKFDGGKETAFVSCLPKESPSSAMVCLFILFFSAMTRPGPLNWEMDGASVAPH